MLETQPVTDVTFAPSTSSPFDLEPV
jgi:hypothetical protein